MLMVVCKNSETDQTKTFKVSDPKLAAEVAHGKTRLPEFDYVGVHSCTENGICGGLLVRFA